MEQRFLFESLSFSTCQDGGVRVAEADGGAVVEIPASLWARLSAFTPAELLAVRDGVDQLLRGAAGLTDETPHEHDVDEDDPEFARIPGPSPLESPIVPGPLVIGGRRVEVPGVTVITFLENPREVPRTTDGRPRDATETVTGIVVHTVHGKRGALRDGGKQSSRALTYAKYQATTKRDVSWHFTVDTDGKVVQSADTSWLCWHAGHVNARTVGIEMVQEKDGTLYKDQIDATVALLETLCRELGVARHTPVRGGKAHATLLLPDDIFAGVYGHRNVWALKAGKKVAVRGHGDPGDWIFEALLAAGFTGVEV